MPFSNYQYGWANGVTVRGVPVLNAYSGNVYWVSSTASNASNGNPGTYSQAFSSINGALAQASANNGDIIVLKPGHAEAITTAAQVALTTAGVAIIGLGVGSSRPTFTYATNTTANIPLTAANVTVQNCLFVCNVAAVVSAFTATGTATPTDLTISNCEFRDVASNKNFISIITGNATANSMDGLAFNNNRISSLGTTTATTAIKLASATDRVQITGNYGNWAVLNDTAAMLAAGANAITNFDFGHNVLNRPNTSSTGGSFISGSSTAWTGQAYYNLLWQLDTSAGIWIPTGTKLAFNQNYSPITGGADTSGLINPAAA